MVRGVLLGLLGALVFGCGSSEGNGAGSSGTGATGTGGGSTGSGSGGAAGSGTTGSGGASGGATGSGGSSGGAGGSSGSGGTMSGPPATDSLRYACREYVRAACERREECTGIPLAGCLSYMDDCPGFLFSEGSSRTRESALACAEVYRSQPCEEVIAHIPPACATPGTLPDGSACRYHSQCAGACSGTTGTCGECIPLAPEDGGCDGTTIDCQPHQVCGGGICIDDIYEVNPTVLPGANCEYSCVTGYYCLRNAPGATPTCLVPPGPGESCVYELIDDGVGNEGACGFGSYCNADFKCEALPEPGQPCAPETAGVRCRTGACTNGVCPIVDNPGTACNTSSTSECTGTTSCRCPTDESCAQGTCVFVREEGESCSGQYDRCNYGTECMGGICVATDEIATCP